MEGDPLSRVKQRCLVTILTEQEGGAQDIRSLVSPFQVNQHNMRTRDVKDSGAGGGKRTERLI